TKGGPMKKLFLLLPLLAASAATAAPSRFGPDSARVTNPWFPLRPGTKFVYQGEKDGKPARDIVTATSKVSVIGGVRCAVVYDRVYVDGRLFERTTDWYAQDKTGTVWYFGEDTAELDAAGRVTTREGTWRTGRNGARPGIFMP